jgi:hypothetical protein
LRRASVGGLAVVAECRVGTLTLSDSELQTSSPAAAFPRSYENCTWKLGCFWCQIRPDRTKSPVMTKDSTAEANQYKIAHSSAWTSRARKLVVCMIDVNSGGETRIPYRKLARAPLCFESIITDGVPRGDHDQEPCFR